MSDLKTNAAPSGDTSQPVVQHGILMVGGIVIDGVREGEFVGKVRNIVITKTGVTAP